MRAEARPAMGRDSRLRGNDGRVGGTAARGEEKAPADVGGGFLSCAFAFARSGAYGTSVLGRSDQTQ